MRPLLLLVLTVCMGSGCLNPFAPGSDTSPAASTCDPTTVEGAFRCFQAAYTFRDTTVYGQLLLEDFVFVYRDYELGVDITWGRDEDMRTTYGLFQNAQKLDLIWNNITSRDSTLDSMRIVRGFNLTVTFNPSDIERVDGYANITFLNVPPGTWKMIRWRDESNY